MAKNDRSAYSRRQRAAERTKTRTQTGRLILLLIGAVTAVDLILKALNVGLTFPCEIYFPLWMTGMPSVSGAGYAVGFLLAAAFLALFVYQTREHAHGRRHPLPFRFGWLLYALDTLFYFGISMSSVASKGFTITQIIELGFHLFCTFLLYRADRAASGKLPDETEEPEEPNGEPSEKRPPDDDSEDDEGIQW